jgi:hypothetical protein
MDIMDIEARLQANSESNIRSAWAAAGLIPFDPNRVLSQLLKKKKKKKKKKYVDRLITSEEQILSNQSVLIPTPRVQIQQGSHTIELPIDKIDEAKEWIDKLMTNTPSIPAYKAKLTAFIDWQVTDRCLKQKEIQSLRKTVTNNKPRSKKVINLKIIDAETYAAYCEEVKKKKANTQSKKSSNKQSKKSSKKIVRKRQKEARSLSASDNEDDVLKEDIELPIGEAFEGVIESESDGGVVERQIHDELQISIGSDRLARSRRLPIRYREE